MVNKKIKIEMEERGEETQQRLDVAIADPIVADSGSSAPGLPEMVPVSVRSDLPEFQSVTIERVLVGLDLTWVEFLALFKIELDPAKYIVKGSGGRQAFLTDNVGEYVNKLKRRMKVYPVTIELINPSTPPKRSIQSNPTARTPPLPLSLARGVPKRKVQPPKWNQANGPPTKIQHLEDKADKSDRSTSKSLPPPSTNVYPSTSKGGQPSTSRNVHPSTSKSVPPSPDNQKAKDTLLLPPPPPPPAVQRVNQLKFAHVAPGPSKPKVNKPIVNAVSPVTNNTAGIHVKATPPPGRQFNGRIGDESESSDEEADNGRERPGQANDDFEIKPSVIQFLIAKISNKNMLRVRDELLRLKAQDDYFQLTCVAPLAAGLLEQMLCRQHKSAP